MTPEVLVWLSWVMAAWATMTRWLLAEQWLKAGWISCFSSQVGWGVLSYYSGLDGMLAFSVLSALISTRGLFKLFFSPEPK